MSYNEQELKERYNCSLGDGGWCDGTKRGSRMRCPAHGLCTDGSRVCEIGIERGLDEMMCMELVTCGSCGWSGAESELEMDYYEERTSPMPLATLCPICKNETA